MSFEIYRDPSTDPERRKARRGITFKGIFAPFDEEINDGANRCEESSRSATSADGVRTGEAGNCSLEAETRQVREDGGDSQ